MSATRRASAAHSNGGTVRARFAKAVVCGAVLALTSVRPASAADVRVRGLLDLVATEYSHTIDLNVYTRGDSPFDAYLLKLFVEGQATKTVQVFSQIALNDASQVRADGAYAMVTPWADRDLHLVAGKIPWLIGAWAPRAYSNQNPLIGRPLMYQFHTTLLWYEMPSDVDALLAHAGMGQSGVEYGSGYAGMGMAVVDDAWWDFGAMATGSLRPLEFAFGAIDQAPGWGEPSRDQNSGKSVLGRIGLAPSPAVRLGVSGSYGPYLVGGVPVEPGKQVEDYAQILGMADLELSAGHFDVHAEAFANTWQTPTVGDLRVDGGYAEGRWTFLPGAYLAARGDVMRFGDVTDSSGVTRPWDLDRDRFEAGLGYRCSRGVTLKAVHQWNVTHEFGTADRVDRLVAGQLSVAF